MRWLLEHCPITKRRYLLVYAGIAALAISAVSVTLAYLSFREFDPAVLNRAILVSFIAPIIVAYPSLCLSISRYAKLLAISEQLELKKKELSDLINVLPDIVSTADASRRLTWVNHKYCEIYGRSGDSLIGRDFLELVHPQSRDTVETVIGNLSPQNPTSSHKELHTLPDGSERWIYWTNMKRFDPGDQPTEILSVGKDITELHDAQLEIEAQAAQLEQSNRALEKVNRELNQFTSFASHDLQEPLRKIGFFSEVLAEALSERDEKTVEYALDVLSTSANRSRALVANLLALSQTSNEPLHTARIDLTKLLDSVISDLSFLIERTSAIIKREDEGFEVEGDWHLTSMMFFNLIQNAIKFTPPDRTPEIRIHTARKPQDLRVVAIEDNGIGFDNKYQRNIFEVFERLHSQNEFEGTGIGLAIVATAVDRLGWQVYAKSDPGRGATFYVEIPGRTKTSADPSGYLPTTPEQPG